MKKDIYDRDGNHVGKINDDSFSKCMGCICFTLIFLFLAASCGKQ